MQDFILHILSLFFGGTVTWLFARKKHDAETTRVHLDNINIAVDIWKNTAKELSSKVDLLTQKCEQLTMEVEMLRKENKSLKTKLDKTIQTIDQNNK